VGDAQSRSLFIGKPFAREVKVAERAEHAHAADRLDRRDFEGFPGSSVGSVYHVGASPLPAADGQDVRWLEIGVSPIPGNTLMMLKPRLPI
jgi:hypothetical protein